MAKKISKTIKAKAACGVLAGFCCEAEADDRRASARDSRSQEQRAATGEILRMIARTPTDLQSVMDATAEMPRPCATRRMPPYGASTAMFYV